MGSRRGSLTAAGASLLGVVLAAALMHPPQVSAVPGSAVVVQSVVTSAYPEVSLRCTLPSEFTRGGPVSFEVYENGEPVTDLQAKALTSRQLKPIWVVLAIDTSGSMKGKALQDAKAAAHRFLRLMRPEDRIALLEFDSSVHTVSPFTGDRARLDAQIDRLAASHETALYDALAISAEVAAKGPVGQRSVVLLSDGGDTVSASSKDDALRRLQTLRVPVYAVALQSWEQDFSALSAITQLSGARFTTADDPAKLSAIYADLALELQGQYELRFKSLRPQTKELQFDVVATVPGGGAVRGWSVAQNPGAGNLSPFAWMAMLPTVDGPAALWTLSVLFGAAFCCVALFAYGAILAFSPESSALEQLEFYDQLRGDSGDSSIERSAFEQAVLGVVGEVAGKRGFTSLVAKRLERAGLPLRPVEYIAMHFFGVVVIGLVTQVLTGRIFLSLSVVVLATCMPVWVLAMLGERRTRRFDEQLPDILNLIAGSLRAGYGLLQAVGLVVEEVPAPASVEFNRVQTEARLGLRLEDAFDKMADRVGSEDFKAVVGAINIQREVGGNLAEILDIVAKTIRERDALRRHVRSLTAEGRMSAVVLTALPFLIALALYFLRPDFMLILFTDPIGRVFGIMSLTALVVGGFWLRNVMRIEV